MTTLVEAQARILTLIRGSGDIAAFDLSVVNATGTEADPTVDANGRVLKYAVVSDGAGASNEDSQASTSFALGQEWQVTCVGPDANACRWVAQQVRARVVSQTVTGTSTGGGVFREVPGIRPPAQVDRDARPARIFSVLLFTALFN